MISIERLRVANLLFAERDYYEEAYTNCEKMVSIKDITIVAQDSLNSKLNLKLDNMQLIIDSKDNIIDLEHDKYNALVKKSRKDKFTIMGISGAFIVLLILL